MKHIKSESGASAVELALLLPLLVLLLLGTIDFGRVFYGAITITNAARAGASEGSLGLVRSGQKADIETRVCNEAATLNLCTFPDIPEVVVERYCECPEGTETVPPLCDFDDTSCGQLPLVFLKVGVNWTFNTIVDYPGIPDSINIYREAIMRVQ